MLVYTKRGSVSQLYYACYIHINFPLESLYQLKKQHQNSLRSFKDLSIQTEKGILFYNMLRLEDNVFILDTSS